MDLTERLIKGISLGIKNALNEAGRISHRTIDRKLWLSVASVISKNRQTEAEFIKPMKKLTKEDLLNRYVAALLIMKKPCPKNEKDIEKLKTLKLFAQKAIQLGATIDDIQNLYNINSGNTQKPQNVKQGFDPSKLSGAKETAREKLGKQDYKEYVDSLKDQLTNKELNGQYLYKYYVSYGYGFGSDGFSVGERKKKDDKARRYVLGTYLMSNENYDIFVSRYTRLITKWARSSWDREVADKMVIGKEGLNLSYIPKLYETKEEAMEDHDGMVNTAVVQFNGDIFPSYFKFNEVVYSGLGSDSYLNTRAGYIPALGELVDGSRISNVLNDIKGYVWTSTFKDDTHVYGYNGKDITLLELGKDSAYVVPFIPIEKGNKTFSYILEQEHYAGALGLNKDDYIKQDKSNLLVLARSWKMKIIESEYNAIENRVKHMSDRDLISNIINLLKKGVGNHNNSNGEKAFYAKAFYDNHWNMRINKLIYRNNRLYVEYWTGGDSTDSTDWINVDNLVGRHTDDHAGTRFSFDAKAKHEILVTGCSLLMYWDKQIKKYQ